MRKRWLKKAGAVYLAASMTLLPVAQSAMAEETREETSSESAQVLLDEGTSEAVTDEGTVSELSEESKVAETVAEVSEESSISESVANASESSLESETKEPNETQVSEEAKTEESESVPSDSVQESEPVVSTEEVTKETETETVKETSDVASEEESTVEESTESETDEVEEFEGKSEEQVLTNASATYESNGYQYTVENGKANLVKYVGNEKNVVIPSKLNGYPVTKLTSDVFRSNTIIESVVIPATITEYEVIGLNLFTNCKSLKYVKIESSADIADSMFDRCRSIETIEITGKPTKIGAFAFQGTNKMKSFQIPASVKTIDMYAFGDSGLEEITIPATVEKLGGGIFEGSEALKHVKFQCSVDILSNLFRDCENLEAVEISGKVTSIGGCAFYNSGIKKFIVPPTVTYIDYYAFYNSKLQQLTIPSTVKGYGTNAFENCKDLISVKIEGDGDISDSMFKNCENLSKLEITGHPTSIGKNAFLGTKLENVVIPDSVTSIGDGNPFKKPSGEEKPDKESDKSNSQDGFYYCTEENESIIVGYYGNAKEVTLPATLGGKPVTEVRSMKGANTITSLVIPKTITSYASGAFTDCTALISIKIESSAVISYGLFEGCKAIKNVTFTGQPSIIGSRAFYGANLKDVVIPSSVQEIGFAAFTEYDASGKYLCTVEREKNTGMFGGIFSVKKGDAVLLDYYGSETEAVIPSQVNGHPITMIYPTENIFHDVQRLTIPASINEYVYMTEGLFTDNKSLRYVKIESSAAIQNYMFSGCINLETVEITGRPTSIGIGAFSDCGLKKINIPTSVTYIAMAAFAGCKFENIVIPQNVETDLDSFAHCPNLVSATVEAQNADIGAMFFGCTNLKRIELTSSVTKLSVAGFNYTEYNNLCGRGVTFYVTEGTPAEELVKDCVQWGFDYVVMPKNQTGLVNMGDNVWYYKINGITQWSYTGLVLHEGTWYYVKNGVLDWNYTGLTYYNGTWYYVQKGLLDWNYTGLTYYNNTWYYVQKGLLNWSYVGLIYYDGTWYYVQKGSVNWNYTGLTYYNNTWYYVQKGLLKWNYTGLTYYNKDWYYVQKGSVNWSYTGLTCYNGTWYYVKKGVLDWSYTGLTEYYGNWYYIQKGVLNWNYTGLTEYYGNWYYVQKGILKWSYTGLTEYYGTWYYVQKGILNWNYTGLTEYYGNWYYVQKGMINWNYTGYVTKDGTRYYVKNGIATIK